MSGPDGYLDAEERESREFRKDTVRQVYGRLLRQKGLFAAGCLLILLGTGAMLLEPRIFGYAIDEAIIPKRWDELKLLALALLAVECVRVASVIGYSYLFEVMGQRVMQELRVSLFAHLQTLPVATFDRNPAGRMITRVTNDISAMADMFSAGFVTIIGNVLTVIGILAWLLVLNWKLGLICATIFPIMVVITVHFSRRLQVAYRDARSKLSALNAFLAENILGMRVLNLFNRQGLHLERFGNVNRWYTEAQIGSVRVFAFFQPTITLAAGVAMALVIYFGGNMAESGTLQLGVLVAYFSYVMALFQPMREIADKWNIFLSGMASAERIFGVLEWEPEMSSVAIEKPAARPAGIRGHIVFEGVWFAYKDEHWVLKDFNLEIRPGMKVGVVGHTGAGKTTLISLLMRFYEPQKGRILLDGVDLREYDKRALRSAIGIIQQDVFLFSGSLRDNLTLWREPGEKGSAALERTLARMEMPRLSSDNAMDLQERGSNLSMGERQVLAFARAVAVDPAIWILDEATANIDSRSEQRLGESLEEASRGRTTIMIAHRLATVRSADLILVLHKGALLEHGSHGELMRQDGLYARMYRYQTVAAQASAGESGVSM